MSSIRKALRFAGPALIAGAMLVVPVSGQKKQKKAAPAPAAAPTEVSLKADIPSLAALEETPQTQTKGGLRITLTPEAFQQKESTWLQSREVPPPTFLGLVAAPAPNAVFVEQTTIPKIEVTPDSLVLHVHLDNQMSRVFRGSGVAVQFNVAGKLVNVDKSGYGDLSNIILPPRSEQEVTIIGPKIASIPSPSTVGIFFFDVVTNMDAAGNVTEKQNFEWYFSWRTQAVEKTVSVPAPHRQWVYR